MKTDFSNTTGTSMSSSERKSHPNTSTQAVFQTHGAYVATRVPEQFLRDAYEANADLQHALQSNPASVPSQLETALNAVARARLPEHYADLYAAARLSPLVAQSLIFAFAVFNGQKRANRNEETIHHTLWVANRVAEMLGRQAKSPIAKALLHDVTEDCAVDNGVLKIVFGQLRADGVSRLSHNSSLPNDRSWLKRVWKKTYDKMERAPSLTKDELLIRLFDNLHEVLSNTTDFAQGMLRVEGEKVVRMLRQHELSTVEEFSTKLAHRTYLHGVYSELLRGRQIAFYGSLGKNLSQIVDNVDREFQAAKRGQEQFLKIPTPLITLVEKVAADRSGEVPGIQRGGFRAASVALLTPGRRVTEALMAFQRRSLKLAGSFTTLI